MAAHVPKFGSWDSENIPYTAYFENARKDKASGVRMNPNDPEENPDAFLFGRGGGQTDGVHVNSTKPRSSEEYHVVGHRQKPDHRRRTSDQQKIKNLRSMNSESGREKSNPEASLVQPVYRRSRSDRRLGSLNEGSDRLPPHSPGPHERGVGSDASDDMSYKSASVPKFGVWDEGDPTSGEGFTYVFEKVKEEKHNAAAKLHTVPPSQPQPQPPQTHNEWNHSPKKISGSKICCCLNPCASE